MHVAECLDFQGVEPAYFGARGRLTKGEGGRDIKGQTRTTRGDARAERGDNEGRTFSSLRVFPFPPARSASREYSPKMNQ